MRQWVGDVLLRSIHGRSLVYNTCWEDPRLDREALEIGRTDRILMITSAGCNALAYALDRPERIDCVDVNPRQNALLELKIAAIRELDYDDFWLWFGQGFHPSAEAIYRDKLRGNLSDTGRQFWDRHWSWFHSPRIPFYFRGTSGIFARFINFHIDRIAKVRDGVEQLLKCQTLEEQKQIFDSQLWPRFWTRAIRAAMRRNTVLAMLGVPREQRRQVEKECEGGIAGFVASSLRRVFTELPLRDNYFWRVYLTGKYSMDCCPDYLTEDGFAALKAGAVNVIHTHTCLLEEFLRSSESTCSRFVFLDHMDWMADRFPEKLERQWNWVLRKASGDARAIWRSGGLNTEYLRGIAVSTQTQKSRLQDHLVFDEQLAEALHARDRVGTYGSFFVADIAT